MRLAPSETSSASFVTTAQDVRGHFDGRGRYVDGGGARDRELRFEVRAMTKLAQSVQVGVIAPYVRTERRFGNAPNTVSGTGAGVGDVTLLSRYDFVRVGGEHGIPGIALTFATTMPTGRGPDRSRDVVGADVTGTGTWEARPGLAIEKSWWTGWFVSGAVGVGFFAPHRRDDGTSLSLGPRLQAFVAGGRTFPIGLGIAFGVAHEQERGARISSPGDGLRVGAMRARSSALAIIFYEIDDHYQLLASFITDFHGTEQTATTSLGIGLRRAWNVY